MNALTLLTDDHAKVKKLLRDLEATSDRATKTREDLFTKVKAELTVHEIIEEEVFYPELKAHPRAKSIVLEAFEEHDVVDTLMGELSALPVEDERWIAKFTVMKENIEHHIDEEEGEMFSKARSIFDRDELDDLGARMERRKAEAMRTVATPA